MAFTTCNCSGSRDASPTDKSIFCPMTGEREREREKERERGGRGEANEKQCGGKTIIIKKYEKTHKK